MKINKFKFKELKSYFLKEKFIILLSIIAFFILKFDYFLKNNEMFYIGVVGIGIFSLLLFDKIGEKYKKLQIPILLGTILGLGIVQIFKIPREMFYKILILLKSIIIYTWITLGSKEAKMEVRKYTRLLIDSYFFVVVFNIILLMILYLLNTVSKQLFGFYFRYSTLWNLNISFYFVFFNYIYQAVKSNYDEVGYKKEKKIVLGLLDLQNIGVLIIFAYIVKIILFKEYPKNTLGRLIPIFFSFAIIKIFLIQSYEKLKLEKIIWYMSPILLYYYFSSYYKRVIEYGLTENRVHMIIFGIFLLLTAFYNFFIKNEDKKLKLILLTFLILTNFDLNFGEKISNLYKKDVVKKEKKYKRNDRVNLNFLEEVEVEKNAKISFEKIIKIDEEISLEIKYKNLKIKKNEKDIFSSDVVFDLTYQKNKKLKEKSEALFNEKIVKIIYNNEEISYQNLVEKIYDVNEKREGIYPERNISKNIYYKIEIKETIIIVPISRISLEIEKETNQVISKGLQVKEAAIIYKK